MLFGGRLSIDLILINFKIREQKGRKQKHQLKVYGLELKLKGFNLVKLQ